MTPTCKECIFFTDPDQGIGFCRRFPPTVIDHKHDRYPYVDGEQDWCGEFESVSSIEETEDAGETNE